MLWQPTPLLLPQLQNLPRERHARRHNGLWVLEQLSPGYAPLMPFLLVDKEHTVSQLYSEGTAMTNLLPANAEFIEGKVRTV